MDILQSERHNSEDDEPLFKMEGREEEHQNQPWSDVFEDQSEVEHFVEQGTSSIHAQAITAMRHVFDPEISTNIYDLGLVYKVTSLKEGIIWIQMTLTSPQCPEAETLPLTVKSYVEQVSGVDEALVDIVWDPPWGMDRMSEAVKLKLGFL